MVVTPTGSSVSMSSSAAIEMKDGRPL